VTKAHSYRPDIDGLRAIAVLAVVGFHYFPQLFPSGFVGVDIFFVISGYLITAILLREIDHQQFSISAFYRRRVNRIFPALLLVTASCLLLGYWLLNAIEYRQLATHSWYSTFFSVNFILAKESGYFDTASDLKPLLHLWSIAIEEQFYVVWPLLLVVVARKAALFFSVSLLLVVLSIGLMFSQGAAFVEKGYFLPQFRVWALILGATLAYAMRYRPTHHLGVFQQAISVLGLLFIVISIWCSLSADSLPGMVNVVAVLGSVMLIGAGRQAIINQWCLSHRYMVWIGLISYPLYLWHWPVLSFFKITEYGQLSLMKTIAACLFSFVLAVITYYWAESPIRKSNHPRKIHYLCLLMISIFVLSLTIYYQNGLPKRYVKNSLSLMQTNKDRKVDQACKALLFKEIGNVDYCRLHDVGSHETVVLYGDSHAYSLFYGFSKQFEKQGVNTLMLSWGGCPLLPNVTLGHDPKHHAECLAHTQQAFKWVAKNASIKKVIIATRGAVYITGTGYGVAESRMRKLNIQSTDANNTDSPQQLFKDSYQELIHAFNQAGKQVYVVTENPELGIDASYCIPRPVSMHEPVNCNQALSSVLERQQSYREVIGQLKGATVIDSLNYFCEDNLCKTFDNGVLLYSDDDHLSMHGSVYLAKHIDLTK
jgi:peptidoglycan/LPS O-acetylase OafA/YrhL